MRGYPDELRVTWGGDRVVPLREPQIGAGEVRFEIRVRCVNPIQKSAAFDLSHI